MNEALQEQVQLVRELEALTEIKEPKPFERVSRHNVMKQLFTLLPQIPRPLLDRTLTAVCKVEFPDETETNFRFQVTQSLESRFLRRDINRTVIPGPATPRSPVPSRR